ncbi:MAG: hypothetical protein LUG27_08325 [Clostridiales bacterium]|nr:hypothetical protein [Clostridiales bacterium]
MKIKMAALCTAAVTLTLLSACGSSTVTENTVELKKDGSIVEYTVEEFSASYYDADELASFVDAEIESYLEENDGEIKVSRNEVEDENAYLTLKYDSADTYADFNGTECFAGSIVQAQTVGYDFDQEFLDVNADGDESDDGSVSVEEIVIQAVVPGSVLIEDDDLQVLIVRSSVNIVVPGKIQYVSADIDVEIQGTDTVVIQTAADDSSSEELIYILYK